ncbi:MAG: glycine zipper 2TM domain-containing protein [Acidobacteria bacterium]|nr:glycine zipper 2TM domain-containing protein [Acidobacteriota bacterium]
MAAKIASRFACITLLATLLIGLGACGRGNDQQAANEQAGQATAEGQEYGATSDQQPPVSPPPETGENAPAGTQAPPPATTTTTTTTPRGDTTPPSTTPAETPADEGRTGGAQVQEERTPEQDTGGILLGEGDVFHVKLDQAVSTKTSTAGEEFTAQITGGVKGTKGWTLLGTVTEVVKPQAKKDTPGELHLAFHTIRTDSGSQFPISGIATGVGGSSKNRNLGIVAGSTIVGALLGKKVGDDKKDTWIGAAAGAAAGAAIVRALPGQHLNLEPGTPLDVKITSTTRIHP